MDHGAGSSGSAQATGIAGKSAAGAEVHPDFGVRRQRQELQRIGDVPRPDLWNASRARSGWSSAASAAAVRRIASSRFCVSRETGVSASARALSAARSNALPSLTRSSRPCRGRACTCATSNVSAAGVTPSMLARRGRWCADDARCSFCFTSFESPAARRSRDRPAARNFRRGDTLRRRPPGATDRHRIWRRSRSARRFSARDSPKRGQTCARSAIDNVRIRQQLERGAALSVFVEREAVTLGFLRRQRNRFGEFARVVERGRFCA